MSSRNELAAGIDSILAKLELVDRKKRYWAGLFAIKSCGSSLRSSQ